MTAPAFNPTLAWDEAQLQGVLDFLNLGPDPATVEIYGTTQPETAGDAAGGAPLVVISLVDPPGSIESGLLVITPTEDALVTGSGGAVWGRVKNGNGDIGFDAAVTDSAGAGPIKIPSTTLYEGGATRIIAGSAFGF